MMSREARQLMMSGQGAKGLEMWKVGGRGHGLCCACLWRPLAACVALWLALWLAPWPPAHPRAPGGARTAAPQDRWYAEKMGLPRQDRRVAVQHYIEGLHWVLEYYYRGVASWNWFYPHHHAPMASDMVDLDAIKGRAGGRRRGRSGPATGTPRTRLCTLRRTRSCLAGLQLLVLTRARCPPCSPLQPGHALQAL